MTKVENNAISAGTKFWIQTKNTRAIFVKNGRTLVPRKHFSRICAVTGWDSNAVPSEYKLEVRALEAADPVISL